MKYTLKFDPNVSTIAADLKVSGNPKWSYMPKYRISNGTISLHSHLDEPSYDTMPSTNLLMGPKLAGKMHLQEGQSFQVEPSNLDAAEYVHLKEVTGTEEALPFVEGVEITNNTLLKYDTGTWVVDSCQPAKAYLSAETDVKSQALPESSEPENTPKLTTTTPSYHAEPFGQIIGHKDTIKNLKRIADKLRNPEKYKKLTGKVTRGVLLHGPPGSGKSSLARESAKAFKLPTISLEGNISSSLICETFAEERLKNGGCIIIDEIDGLSDEAFLTLQQCMDGLYSNERIITVATTNHLSKIPDELKRSGRFTDIVFVGLPDRSDRANLFDLYLSDRAADPSINDTKLAQLTQGFTGADIEQLVNKAGDKAIERLESGETNVVITREDIIGAQKGFQSTGAKVLNVRTPTITFEDITGNEDVKDEIKSNLDLITGKKKAKYSRVKRQYILLHGPPGNGKTMRAEAMASYAGVLYKYMSSNEIESKWVGESEKAWRKLFQDARNYAPCLLFIDEFDSLTGSREHGHSHDQKVLNTVLSELDGKASNDGLIIVGATNRIEDLDSAILDRFSFKYKIDLPDEINRAEFLKNKFTRLPKNELDYMELANMTKGWSYRKLNSLIDEVALKLDAGSLHQINTNQMILLIKKIKRQAISTNNQKNEIL